MVEKLSWKQFQDLKCEMVCLVCREDLVDEPSPHPYLFGYYFHINCLDKEELAYKEFINNLLQATHSGRLPSYEDYDGWTKANQRELGVKSIEVAKVVGSSEIINSYYSDWMPRRDELATFRYERILSSAFTIQRHCKDPGRFIDSMDHKHVFYVPRDDKYYVCADGNRRTSVAHLLSIKRLKYEVTTLEL